MPNNKSIYTEIQTIIQAETNAIQALPIGDHYQQAVDLIHKHVHQLKGKLITTGMGKAGQIALNMATTFSSTGTPAMFLHPSEAQHGDLGIVQTNDIMILISNSGRTREIVELVSLSRNLNPDIPFIVITGNPTSDLGKAADVIIPTGNPTEVCTLGLTPTTSTTIMTVIGDILVVLLMKK